VAGERLLVAFGAPAGFRRIAGAERLARLTRAHPRVTVEIAEDEARFSELLPEADGVLVFGEFARLLGPALRPGGRLRWVHSLPVGVDHLLTPEVIAAEHVALTSSKGPMGPLMAEHIVMLMLALARDLPGFLRDQAERRWRFMADERPMVDLLGKTIAILGIGNVGSHLARICKLAFGMRVLGMTRTRRDDPYVDGFFERAGLHAALAEADFVALALALTPETDGILDAAAQPALGDAKRYHHPARLAGPRPLRRADGRLLVRERPPVRRGRAAAGRRGPARGVLTPGWRRCFVDLYVGIYGIPLMCRPPLVAHASRDG
jgi:hypothetical protein